MRAANDFYPTPFSIIEKLLSQLDWPAGTLVWEPCVGDGRVADALVSHGYNVVTGDITTGDDFFEVTAAKSPYLLTNPHSPTSASSSTTPSTSAWRRWRWCAQSGCGPVRGAGSSYCDIDPASSSTWTGVRITWAKAVRRIVPSLSQSGTAQTTPRRILMSGTALRSVDICSRYVLLFSNTRGTEK